MNKNQMRMYFSCAPYQAFFSHMVDDEGMGNMVLARKSTSNIIAGAVFLCDHYCLGVKDCFPFGENEMGYNQIVRRFAAREPLEPVTPGYLKAYTIALVAWARGIGFEPHPDYRLCREVLQGITPDPDASFTFGKDGMPYYIQGPNDTPRRQQQIIQTLEAYKARTGNEVHYMVGLTEENALEIIEPERHRRITGG